MMSNLLFEHIDPAQKKPKCAQYWPNKKNEDKLFGQMQIKLLGKYAMKDSKTQNIDDVIERDLEVSNGYAGKHI